MDQQQIHTGLDEKCRRGIADGLSRLLADTYTLYLKTQQFHWNVTGSLFQSLHAAFEVQYSELANAVDLIAERIRALGFFVRATYRDFSTLTAIKESEEVLSGNDMVRELMEAHEVVIRTVRAVFLIAEKADDQATLDMLTDRLLNHEKTAWMLRSSLEN